MRPVLYDAYSGAGGGAKGYMDAGFEVWGIDNRPQPRYIGDRFIQMDFFAFAEAVRAGEYPMPAAWHASPPCQAYTSMSNRHRGKGGAADRHPDLLPATRALLQASGKPYVIENVPGAKRSMRTSLVLSGGMFGLRVERPRIFESNVLLLGLPPRRTHDPIGVYGRAPDGRRLWSRADGSIQRCAASLEEAREVMGIDWMDWRELANAIPPAYAEYIGRQLMAALTFEEAV